MDKETLIRIAEELHQGAFDAKAYYLIMQQYRKNQHNYVEEMKVSPAFYHTVYDALMKACFVEIAKLYDRDVYKRQPLQTALCWKPPAAAASMQQWL